ncbi:EF-hand calcium-binding domain-containing protein 1-like [Homalodisca vitripennis]|uniref:EF-hand calcium-binding domain-containing protein 1-like n=1 Tax=Homalodisca vitripennis TaxID=197043 RepID=UPI001EECA7FE|nr:EF-hand calcium-binding domain-containing protein 1-like [Homalodisca vitripennis]KAG8287970.1 EF-hand calcium-binding domain-containing protein 1 [Homalodisca vitripennis]
MDFGRIDLTLDPQEEVRCRKRFRPIIKEFGSRTKFTHKELEGLLIIYHKLTKNQPMDRKYFRRVMFTILNFQNDALIDRIFSAIDRNNKLVVTMDSWILGMSIFLRGDLNERIKFCFTVYDMMGDGYIKREHMFQALKNSLRGNPHDEDPEEQVKDMIDIILKKMDHDRDGRLSYEDYRKSVWENPSLLEILGYCLPARPAVYMFMTTFTDLVSTLHVRMMKRRTRHHSE